MGELRLEARDFAGPARWRWVLTGPDGDFTADHEVRLDAGCWQYEAFTDLLGYLRWHAAPDRRDADEARIVAEVGEWIGAEVLGPVAAAMAGAGPATVRVMVPEEARVLLYRPLGLAHVNGRPLAVQDVALVMQPSFGDSGRRPGTVGGPGTGAAGGRVADRLRVLGLFSMPEGGQALNLRRERHSLVQLIDGITAGGKAADVRVLQYGVTRDRLRDVLEEGEGWDIIHISGHGAPGELLLETEAGRPDRVPAGDLADLLELARERVSLVTVSACWSAAVTAAEQRRLLGLPGPGGGARRGDAHVAVPPSDEEDSEGTDTGVAARTAVVAGGEAGGEDANLRARADLGAAVAGDGGAAFGALAVGLAERLDCAVLAMRYPVDDDFAIALTGRVYELLAAKGQPLPRAVGMALRQLAGTPDGQDKAARPGPGGMRFPTLSVATPALFGSRAVGLRLAAPARRGADDYDTGELKLAGFPPQPDRFVGRTGVMARASAALARGSRVPGVLLYGMPGGGKTACAVELSYTHQHAFDRLVWYKAPDEGMDISGALADFALTLERDLPGFQMAHLVGDERTLAGFAPRLTELAERRRVLIVIDNAESLLSDGGQWRDERWELVVGALSGHRGLGRLLLTSRRIPAGDRIPAGMNPAAGGAGPGSRTTGGAGLAGSAGAAGGAGRAGLADVLVLTVDALSADEALLLARELPGLRALIEGRLSGVERDVARRLALGVLNVAQGHPKLLELADGQAGDPVRLAALVAAGDQAWREAGGLPDGFFAAPAAGAPGDGDDDAPGTGGDALSPGDGGGPAGLVAGVAGGREGQGSAGDYLHVLAAWTGAVAGTLTAGERTLFWFLCCLEEPDRIRPVLYGNWAGLWQRLALGGQPLELDQTLAAVAAVGLVAVRSGTGDAGGGYAVHPGVAAAGRARAGRAFQAAVDAGTAGFWAVVFRQASGEGGGAVDTGLLVRAGLAAVPYLVRLEEWDAAGNLLQRAFNAEPTRANAAAVLPAIGQVAARAPSWGNALARVLELTDPAAAERELRGYLDAAVACGDYSAASSAAGQMVDLCRGSGRLAEALDLAGRKAGYTRQAGLGPWTQLADEVWRLQVLNAMGRAGQVLDEVQGLLRDRLPDLPAVPGPDETVNPWNVREALLDTGRRAALLLGRWQDALDLSAQQAASKRGRAAPATDIARARFNDHGPLLRLDRAGEALELLLECRQVFQDARDTEMLGKTLSALANVEDARGRGDAAISLERDALRYEYLAGDVTAITVSYHNLGNYLHRHARQPVPALACHLAAALIGIVTGIYIGVDAVHAAAYDLGDLGDAATLPADVAELCRLAGDIPGTDPARLIAALAPDAAATERMLRDLTAKARELAAAPPGEDASG